MPLLSLAALTILDAGPAGQIRAAAEAGFESVGLRLNPHVASDPHIVGNLDRQREIESLLRDTGIKVLEVGVFPIRPETSMDEIAPVMAFSHKIGAQFLVCPIEDPEPQRRIETFGRICELAESCALAGLIEFNPYSACASLAEALEILRLTGAENGALVIDALHLSRSGGSPADLKSVDPSLLQLSHFCDAPLPPTGRLSFDQLRAESRTARMLPGEGALWLHAFLDAMPANAPISIEAPTARDAGLSASERARRALAATRAFMATRPS